MKDRVEILQFSKLFFKFSKFLTLQNTLKINNRFCGTISEIYSQLKIRAAERDQWLYPDVICVNLEQTSQFILWRFVVHVFSRLRLFYARSALSSGWWLLWEISDNFEENQLWAISPEYWKVLKQMGKRARNGSKPVTCQN